jgi:diguanylate cyclase (GGDEF)-like protein
VRRVVAVFHRLRTHRWAARLLIAVISVCLIGGAAGLLSASQASAHRGVSQRYDARAGLAANFVSTYVSQLTSRERSVALATLTGRDPPAAFDQDVRAFGFQTAVVLDDHGRALSIVPSAPSLIGQQYSSTYAELGTALAGHIAVSNIVTFAGRGSPVVAFSVPFSTQYGLRVFSGAYAISQTPLAAFLSDTTTQTDAQVYLTDDAGAVLASNGAQPKAVRTLGQREPALGRAMAAHASGQYRVNSTSYTFVRKPVAGTPWSLTIVIPTAELYVSVVGASHWLPWLILVALSLLMALAALLTVRMLEGRRRLAHANRKLATLARTDGLSGLFNRLYVTEQLETLLANSSRYHFPVCVLMIDIDHFKQLNDKHGHQAGDEAIRHIADRLRISVRDGDLLGRWGGEEFLAVLPHTSLEEGLEVAERLRRLVALVPIEINAKADVVTIQISIGVAQSGDDSLAALVHRADLGLYEAKAAGRNAVRVFTPTADNPAPLVSPRL